MQNPFDGVHAFVETVKAGSFAGAAEQLSLTRSALSKAITKLEARLNVRLLHRSTRSLTLTEDGRLYFESCRRALDELASTQSQLESGRQDVTGRLRVSMPVLYGREVVAPLLRQWATGHPGLVLELSLSDRPVDLIAEGVDLAIRHGELKDDGALRARRLLMQHKVLCAAPAYLARHGKPLEFQDLGAHEHLVYRRGNFVQPLEFEGVAGQRLSFTPQGRFRADDLAVMLDACLAGMGLAWLPQWLVQGHLDSAELVPLLASYRSMPQQTSAVWVAHQAMPPRLRQAIDLLVAQLPRSVSRAPAIEPAARAAVAQVARGQA